MSRAHTPGPWIAEQRTPQAAHSEPYWRVLTADGSCMYVGCGDVEDEADARLIAAAPDLLAALQDVLKRSRPNGNDMTLQRISAIATAAIAKATGAAQ